MLTAINKAVLVLWWSGLYHVFYIRVLFTSSKSSLSWSICRSLNR